MSRNPEAVSKQIRRLRERRRPMSWVDICIKLKIFKKDNVTPDTGMASMLAYGRKGEPYRPSEKVVLERLNFPVVCKECHRPMRERKSKSVVLIDPYQIFWNNLSTEQKNRAKNYICYLVTYGYSMVSNPIDYILKGVE